MLMDEIVEYKQGEVDNEKIDPEEDNQELELFIREWEKEFDRYNPDPENNSDFDSDNEINPLDTLTSSG